MEKLQKKNKFELNNIIFYFVLYKVVLELVYIPLVFHFKSFRAAFIDINYLSLVLSYVYTVVIALLAPRDKDKPSAYLFIILSFFSFIPLFSYYSMTDQSHLYAFYIFVCALIIEGILRINIKGINIKFKYAKHLLWAALIFYVLSTIYVIFLRGGVDFRAFNFKTLYSLREEYNLSGIFSYIGNWSAKAFCPFFIAYFWYKKRYLGVAGAVILQLLMYLSFGNKAFLFSVGIIFMIIILAGRKHYMREFGVSMMGLNFAGLVLLVSNITNVIADTITNRLIYIPAKIQFQHYEFFVNRDKMLFADSQLRVLFNSQSPFNMPVSNLLGELLYGPGVNANTGIFGDAYANGGFLMMIILTAIFALILKFIDISTQKIPAYITAGALSYIMFVVCDTPLFTTLNTGGLIIMIILLVIFNSKLTFDEHSIQKGN